MKDKTAQKAIVLLYLRERSRRCAYKRHLQLYGGDAQVTTGSMAAFVEAHNARIVMENVMQGTEVIGFPKWILAHRRS